MQKLPDYASATQSITPQIYRGLLKGLNLVDLRLEEVSGKLENDSPVEPDALNIRVQLESTLIDHDSEAPIMLIGCLLRTHTDEEKSFCTIKATYRLRFSVDHPLPIEFFAIYQRNSAYAQIWPCLRELAFSLTSRMGVSPITLPLLTSDVRFQNRADKPV
jgi:hypothetical protein